MKCPNGYVRRYSFDWVGRKRRQGSCRLDPGTKHQSGAKDPERPISFGSAVLLTEPTFLRPQLDVAFANIQSVGIDEKSFGRGRDYISVLTDLDHARVVELVPGRDKGAACSLFKTLTAQELEELQAVAMDMNETIAAAARDIVYDRFHVSQALNQAVDQVRRAENKALLTEGDERLKGTRQPGSFNPEPPGRSA
jgi:transposase